jgi:large subunit ribosomal protein L25
MDQLEVHCRADALPEGITIDVSACGAGTTIRIGDLQLPKGVETTKDADLPVLTVNEPHISADVAAALDAEEAAHEAEKAAHEEEAAEAAAEGEESEPEAAPEE